jgi:hypothetical protein
MSTSKPDITTDPFEEGEFVAAPSIESQVKVAEPVAAGSQVKAQSPVAAKAPEPVAGKPSPPSFQEVDLYQLANLPKPAETGSLTVRENDDPDDDELGVEESKTKLPIYKQSAFKMAVIGAMLFAIVAGLSKLVFPGEEAPKIATAPTAPTEKKKVDFEPDPRMGVLSSKVAIQDQKNAIAAAQKQQEEQAAKNKVATAPGQVNPNQRTVAIAPVTPAPVAPATATPPPPPVITNNNPSTASVYNPPKKIIYRRYKTPRPQPIEGLNERQDNTIARNQPVPRPQPKIIARSQPIPQPQAKIIASRQPVPQPQAKIITSRQPVPQSPPRIITSRQPILQSQPRIITSRQPILQSQPRIITSRQPIPQSQPRIITNAPITPPPTPANWETANSNAVGTWGRTNRMSIALTPTNPNGANGQQQQQGGNPSVVLNSPNLQSEPIANNPVALVGQQLRAKTIVPYQVANNNKGYQTIVVALSDPLTDTNGNIMLPAGTQIMTDITVLDNGLMQIASAKIFRNNQMIELPKQSLVLQDGNKQPLIAQSRDFGGGDIANRDLTTIGAGALQGVGKNLIQSQTQTIIANGATIQSSNGQVNYAGAALDGGLTPVLNQWAARNQAAATQVSNTSKLWLLPTGTEVNLIIAQPFSL